MRDLYRKIPKVDVLLAMPQIQELVRKFGQKAVTECIREEMEKVRALLKQGDAELFEKDLQRLPDKVCTELTRQEESGFRRVINATGTILHTNLDAIDSLKDKADLILRATALPKEIIFISSMGAALRFIGFTASFIYILSNHDTYSVT